MGEPSPNRIGHLALIDDDEIDQILHRRIIERSGIVDQLHSFRLASDALDYLGDGGPIDLILLDIRMPGMSGFEFLDAATKRLGAAFAPIVMILSTSMDPTDRQRADANPLIRGYLEKPLADDTLAMLGSLVAEPGRPEPRSHPTAG